MDGLGIRSLCFLRVHMNALALPQSERESESERESTFSLHKGGKARHLGSRGFSNILKYGDFFINATIRALIVS